jgi:hypothetical protein
MVQKNYSDSLPHHGSMKDSLSLPAMANWSLPVDASGMINSLSILDLKNNQTYASSAIWTEILSGTMPLQALKSIHHYIL